MQLPRLITHSLPHFLAGFILVLTCQWCEATAVNSNSSVPYEVAIQDAKRVASLNDNWEVMRASGVSMDPYYGRDAIVVIDRSSFGALRQGMLVVYTDGEGEYVGHLLVRKTEQGWIAKGVNNKNEDPGLVTAKNFVGTIFGVLNTAGLPKTTTEVAATAIDSLPVVYGKRY